MKILAIETSCDETAIAVVEAQGLPAPRARQAGDQADASFAVLGNALLSQAVHAEYGGVFPALAKREHAKNLVPLLEAALSEAELLVEDTQALPAEVRGQIAKLLEREGELSGAFFAFIQECEPPAIDAIAVTQGPGLEPALWVGINFARALALAWEKPLVAVNHMEGHILSALLREQEGGGDEGIGNSPTTYNLQPTTLPLLALLISGGHTELVLMKEWLQYELIGQTRDDAVGEAFDKVARMLALPYPGGPEISRLAEQVRTSDVLIEGFTKPFILPRPMIHDATCDFSFAGLKTAVLYLLKSKSKNTIIYDSVLSEEEKREIALEFENAVADVLWHKTARALTGIQAHTLVIGGGVSANTHIRRIFTENIANEFPDVALRIPSAALTTDNAVMIGLAGYFRALRKEFATEIAANGNLSLAQK